MSASPACQAPMATGVAKRSSMACTTCRQVKLKCDALKRFPNPCSRCEKQKRKCLWDPGFKRRPVRGALEKITQEKEQLENLVDSLRRGSPLGVGGPEPAGRGHCGHSLGDAASPCSSPPEGSTLSGGSSLHPSMSMTPATATTGNIRCTSSSFQLHDVYLDRRSAEELVKYFSDHYFQHLPILDTKHKDVDTIFKDSNLLFWVIIITAARGSQNPLGTQLLQPVKRLLSDQLVTSIRSIHTIQALLVLCFWPFPVEGPLDDPSWTHCSIAVSAAMQTCLGRADLPRSGPHLRWDAAKGWAGDPTTRMKTWLGCFVVSTSLAANLGLPPPMSMVANKAPSMRQSLVGHVPDDFLRLAELQEYWIRVTTIIEGSSSGHPHHSLLNMLQHELDCIKGGWPVNIPLWLEINLLASRLHLCTATVSTNVRRETKLQAAELRTARYQSFDAASRLIDLIISNHDQSLRPGLSSAEGLGQSSSSPESTPNEIARVWEHYPKIYLRAVVTAALCLVTTLAADHFDTRMFSREEGIMGRQKAMHICAFLRSLSRSAEADGERAAGLLELLVKHAEDGNSGRHFREAELAPQLGIIQNSVDVARGILDGTAEKNPASASGTTGTMELPMISSYLGQNGSSELSEHPPITGLASDAFSQPERQESYPLSDPVLKAVEHTSMSTSVPEADDMGSMLMSTWNFDTFLWDELDVMGWGNL